MRHSSLAIAVLLAGFAIPAAAVEVDVVLINKSDWDIHHLFLSPTSDDDWGSDQLGEHVLEAGGGQFTLTGVPCSEFDVKLIDEDGDECVVPEVPICGDDEKWVITNDDLLACEFGE